jgi:N-acetylneuraminic acid mutarotase
MSDIVLRRREAVVLGAAAPLGWPAVAARAQAQPRQRPPASPPSSPAPAQAGPWQRLAPFPEPSEELLGAGAIGRLYVFAGLAPGWRPQGMVYEYDPVTDTWTRKRPMPVPTHHVAFTTLNDRIYAFGGFTHPGEGRPPSWVPTEAAWEYDPRADDWRRLAPMPSRRGAAAAAAVNGRLYVVGGAGLAPGSDEPGLRPDRAHRVLGTVEEYDPESNSWRARGPMPTPRNHHAVAAVGRRIYAIGGRIGAAFITVASNTDVVEEYDPSADAWGPIRARMPTPRSAIAWGVHEGRIYIAGGEFQDARMMATYRGVEAYEPATNRWSVMPPMPVPRHGLAGAVVGDRLHLVSGDVQSAGTGVPMHTAAHDVLRLDAVPP